MTNEQRGLMNRAVEGIERIADSLEEISESIAGIREAKEGEMFFIDEDMETSGYDGDVFGFEDGIGFMCDSDCGVCGGGCEETECLDDHCGGDHECNCGCTTEKEEENHHNCKECGNCEGHDDDETEEETEEITEEEVIIGIGNAIQDILGIFGITETEIHEGKRKAEKIVDILRDNDKPKQDIGCIELSEADIQEVKERINQIMKAGYKFDLALATAVNEMLGGKGIEEIHESGYRFIKELVKSRL